MNRRRISISVQTYNRGRSGFLCLALKRFLVQTHGDFELLVVPQCPNLRQAICRGFFSSIRAVFVVCWPQWGAKSRVAQRLVVPSLRASDSI